MKTNNVIVTCNLTPVTSPGSMVMSHRSRGTQAIIVVDSDFYEGGHYRTHSTTELAYNCTNSIKANHTFSKESILFL